VRPYLEKPFTKIGLVEWLKVKALSSSPSTTKKQNMALGVYLSGRMLILTNSRPWAQSPQTVKKNNKNKKE
jgi:hypothetical protein